MAVISHQPRMRGSRKFSRDGGPRNIKVCQWVQCISIRILLRKLKKFDFSSWGEGGPFLIRTCNACLSGDLFSFLLLRSQKWGSALCMICCSTENSGWYVVELQGHKNKTKHAIYGACTNTPGLFISEHILCKYSIPKKFLRHIYYW